MMATLNQTLTRLYALCTSPMASWPDWLSLGLISGLVGILLLVAYKYTSDQKGIERARDKIKARMLAMRLYKDSLRVMGTSQIAVLGASLKILLLSIPPVLVAMIPLMPLLAQMAGQFFFAPLAVDQNAIITAYVTRDFAEESLEGNANIELDVGADVEIVTPRWRQPVAGDGDHWMVKWEVRPKTAGMKMLTFKTRDAERELEYVKKMPVGDHGDFNEAISPKWTTYYSHMLDNTLMLPYEQPTHTDGPVRAVEVTTMLKLAAPDVLPIPVLGNWLVYFLIVSIIFALLVKPVLGVKI